MTNYLVIGVCLALLIAVVYIAAKPIGMGIEARRNINDKKNSYEEEEEVKIDNTENKNEDNIKNISDEILRLNKLMDDGILTEEDYIKAKKKILS